jgi:anti-sigma factor RsiW
MDPTQSPPVDAVSEDDLHAWVDGRLSDRRRQRIEERIARDPAAAATVLAWQQQRDALRGLHAQVLNDPLPPTLLLAARQATELHQQFDQWWRWGGMAAGVLLAFGLGWLSHGSDGSFGAGPGMRQSALPLAAGASGIREFIHQATVAHAVYAPEVRHPVEVAAAQQEHLVQWLSKRLAHPLKVPNLSPQGYELVGGRLLPGTEGARAQFMFQNATGERVTLYLGAMKDLAVGKPAPAGTPDRRETAFSFSSDGPVPGFDWVDQGFGYALAGNLSREKLLAIAQAVYQQL